MKSIFSLDCNDFEYIIIDGASTDNSVDSIKEHGNKVSYWISEPDRGIFHAMNKGIEKATGEYLLFMNSGDHFLENADLKNIMESFSGEDIIYYDQEVCSKNGTFIKVCPDYPDVKFFFENTLPHSASFIKRELFLKYGYYKEQYKLAGDWGHFFKMICDVKSTYKHIHGVFSVFYTDGVSSDSNNLRKFVDEKKMFIKEELPLYYNLYVDWFDKMMELYWVRNSAGIRFLKRIGCLKWFRL